MARKSFFDINGEITDILIHLKRKDGSNIEEPCVIHIIDQILAKYGWTLKEFDKEYDRLLDKASKGMKKPKGGWSSEQLSKIARNMVKITEQKI